jgi:4-amino-4-deoxy-L-arabinose transferase-like glycosyltransferase
MDRSEATKQLAFVLLAHALVGSLLFRYGTDLQDEGLLLAWGKRILEGELPYTDFYAVQAPGTFYIAAALTKLFGTSLLAGRVFMQLQGLLIVALSYLVVRQATGNGRAAVVAAISTTVFSAAHHFRMPWYSTDACICLLAASWFAILWLAHRKVWLVFAAGVALGLATLFKQNLGVFVATAHGLMLLWIDWRERRTQPPIQRVLTLAVIGLTLIAGFAASVGGYLAYYVGAGGSLRLLWLNGFVWSSEAKDFPSPLSLLLYPLSVFSVAHKSSWTLSLAALSFLVGTALVVSKRVGRPVRILGVFLVLAVFGLGVDAFVRVYILSFMNILFFAIAAASLIEAVKAPTSPAGSNYHAYAAALVAVSAASTTYAGAIPGGGWGRMVGTWAGCLLSVGIGAHLLSNEGGVVAGWWRRNVQVTPRAAGATLGVISVLVSAGLLVKNQAFRPLLDVPLAAMTGTPRSAGWQGLRGDPVFVQETDGVIEEIKKMSKAERNRIYVFPLNCALYALADAKNATGFDSHQIDFLAPSQFDDVLTQLRERKPAAIVYQRRPNASFGARPEEDHSWVRDDIRNAVLAFMHAHYKLARSWAYYELWLPEA